LSTLEDFNLTVDDIENLIIRVRPKLVIIDSFKMFMSFLKREELNTQLNNESVLEVFTKLIDWKKRYGVTILLTNHANKGTSGQNGHSDLLYGPGALFDWIYRAYCATCTGHVVPLKTDVISRPNLHINL